MLLGDIKYGVSAGSRTWVWTWQLGRSSESRPFVHSIVTRELAAAPRTHKMTKRGDSSFVLLPFLLGNTSFHFLGPPDDLLNVCRRRGQASSALLVRSPTMLFFRLFFKATWWFITLSLVNPFYDAFQQLAAVYLRWNPASNDSSMLNALRSEYTGLERLINDRTLLISPLSRNMHLGSSTMDEIITIIRSSSIDSADALVRTLFHLSADATAIGKDLQAYSH